MIAVVLTFLFILPTTIGTLKDYFTQNSSARVSFTEALALDTLRRQPPGIVLSPVYAQSQSRLTPEPRSLYGYTSTAYISALTGHKEYLSDTINLDITGFDYAQRIKNIYRLQNTQDQVWARKFLRENNISYVYKTPFMSFKLNPDQLCLSKIFDSGEINIYKFNCQ